MACVALVGLLCLLGLQVHAEAPIKWDGVIRGSDAYEVTDVKIPMRDGVRLSTHIWTPVDATDELPILFLRSPYGWGRESVAEMLDQQFALLAEDRYVFVFQDIRGREESEGEFIMLRPSHDPADPAGIDETTDAYDSVEWLIQNLPGHNDKVGILGISYGAWLTLMALKDPHPAIAAASEQASPADMFIGDDFHHNGALRLGYAFEYAARMEGSKEQRRFEFGNYDTYEWYLGRGTLENMGRALEGTRPSWIDFVEHPNYDEFWQAQSVPPQLTGPHVPTLHVAGWFDPEDFYGPLTNYATLEKHDPDDMNFIVIGPWNHGGWVEDRTGRMLGSIDFGSDTSSYYRHHVEREWFAKWLKNRRGRTFPEAEVFQTGCNEWRTYDRWPPANVESKNLYMQPDGGLAFSEPGTGDMPYREYKSDPWKPVPYRLRPIPNNVGGGAWATWHVDDQRFVHLRPDVLSWESEPLTEDIRITGDVAVKLFASTSGTDAHWIAKLIDVYPGRYPERPDMGGYQLMVGADVVTSRFRNGLEEPEPVEPNKIVDYVIPLHQRSHCFRKGHRIMVQVQSTWFPLIARSPQKFLQNPHTAKRSDYEVATQRIYSSTEHPSHVLLPVEIEDR